MKTRKCSSLTKMHNITQESTLSSEIIKGRQSAIIKIKSTMETTAIIIANLSPLKDHFVFRRAMKLDEVKSSIEKFNS